MNTIKPGRGLFCGCCGKHFYTWTGYVDQDQDKGFGICRECQAFIADKNRQEMDRAIDTLRAGLNETNTARFDAMERDMQECLVWQAFDDGILTYTFKRGEQ